MLDAFKGNQPALSWVTLTGPALRVVRTGLGTIKVREGSRKGSLSLVTLAVQNNGQLMDASTTQRKLTFETSRDL